MSPQPPSGEMHDHGVHVTPAVPPEVPSPTRSLRRGRGTAFPLPLIFCPSSAFYVSCIKCVALVMRSRKRLHMASSSQTRACRQFRSPDCGNRDRRAKQAPLRNMHITICKIRKPVEIHRVMQGAQIRCSVITWRGGMGWEGG